MALTLQWKHPEGYISPSAHLVILELRVLPHAEEVRVRFGIWENQQAYEVRGEALTQEEITISFTALDTHNLARLSTALDIVYGYLATHPRFGATA